VTATFNRIPYALTVRKAGTGSGTVTSNPTGITCGSDCSQSYNSGTAVTLTATPASGSVFAGWGGACSGGGTNSTCTVTMNQARSVTATFNVTYLLTVGKRGNGSGTVTSTPTGITCGSDCTHRYNHGTKVTLTATARSDSVFAGWQGACSGTSHTCPVTLTQAKTATALFAKKGYYLLTVSKAGTSSGMVTSRPTGISCGSDCDHSYRSGTRVTLTARASSSAVFAGWGGACSGSGRSTTCQVTLSGTRAVTATLNRRSQAGAYDGQEWLLPLEWLPDTGNTGESATGPLPWQSGQ
jgi:Fe-S cluster biogenesis protein NfuA